MATHSSILAWESPWTEEPGGLQSMGQQRVVHNLATEHACRNLQPMDGLIPSHPMHTSCRIWFGSGSLGSLLSRKSSKNWVRIQFGQKMAFFLKSKMAKSFISFLNMCQFSSVTHSCLTLCNPMGCSTQGLPVHHQLLEFTQTHIHCVGDAIQPSHPLSSPSPPAFHLSQHQGLFKRVSSLHHVAKVLEFQLQHQSFQ